MSIESRRPSADTNAKRVAPWLSRHDRVPNVGLSLPIEELPNNAMEPSACRLGRAAAHPYHLGLGFLLQRFAGFLNHINRVGDILGESRGGREIAFSRSPTRGCSSAASG
jgi:hypothetical protein